MRAVLDRMLRRLRRCGSWTSSGPTEHGALRQRRPDRRREWRSATRPRSGGWPSIRRWRSAKPIWMAGWCRSKARSMSCSNCSPAISRRVRAIRRWRGAIGCGVGPGLGQANHADRARSNVAHHYDLNGQLYSLFLDRDRQYSCAYFARGDETLEEAQTRQEAPHRGEAETRPAGPGGAGHRLRLGRHGADAGPGIRRARHSA